MAGFEGKLADRAELGYVLVTEITDNPASPLQLHVDFQASFVFGITQDLYFVQTRTYGVSVMVTELGRGYWHAFVPLHFGNRLQPQNFEPVFFPRLAVLNTISELQRGHDVCGTSPILGSRI